MNHPRLPLRRLLFLVPLALLGAAWLVRARLPRPQTEGDKWLWEQGESVNSVDVVGGLPGGMCLGFCLCDHTTITDRAMIRALLRAFKDTPAFSPETRPVNFLHDDVAAGLAFRKIDASCYGADAQDCFMGVSQDNGRYYLWRSNHTQTPIDAPSLTRFQTLCQIAILKAKHHQAGYTISQGECID